MKPQLNPESDVLMGINSRYETGTKEMRLRGSKSQKLEIDVL